MALEIVAPRAGRGGRPHAWSVGVLVVALGALLAACQPARPAAPGAGPSAAPTAAAAPASEVARLVAAARATGQTELQLAWSDNTLGGGEGARRFEELFNRTYGTQITIHFTPGPSMTDMSAKISQEAAAGHKASTDVLIGAESHFGALLDRDVLERYDYTQLSPRITPAFVAPPGVAVEFTSRLPGITYHSGLVAPADVPRLLTDTLHPRWKDRIASTVNAASFDRVASRPEWGAERMRAYVTDLARQVAGLVRCGESARLLSGEFAMVVMDCGSYEANRAKAQGVPLGHVIPEDAATVIFFYMGVPRTAAHPDLAKLFIGLLMTEEGQRLLYEVEFTDHYQLAGSRSVAELEGLRAKGIEPLRIDAAWVAAHPEVTQLGNELTRILREQR